MKIRLLLLALLPVFCSPAAAQQKEAAETLVEEGIVLHDKGDFEGAVQRYDRALLLDQDNVNALGEKALTLLAMQKYDEAIAFCKKAIEKHPGEAPLTSVYVTYGNALDELQQGLQSLEVYDEGIKAFPDNYQLYFNKGIALSSMKRYNGAVECYRKAIQLNPAHPGSHNALARTLKTLNLRIPALLAYSRFLVLEPASERAAQNLASMVELLKRNVEQTDKKSVTVTLDPEILGDTTEDGKEKENGFRTADLMLTMAATLDFDKKYKNKPEVEKFRRKFESLCAVLEETAKDNFGFFWDYYVPYFIEMNQQQFTETFSYLAFASSDERSVSKWLKSHKSDLEKFYDWSKNFIWKRQ